MSNDPSYGCADSPECIEVCTPQTGFLSDLEKTCLRCPNSDGQLGDIKSFNDNWATGKCRQFIENCYIDNGSNTCLNSETAVKRTTRVLSYMMGSDGSGLDTSGVNQTQNGVLNMCNGDLSNAPGACDYYIRNILSKNSNYTYDSMTGNPGIANWLGCYIAPPANEIDVSYSSSSSGDGVTPQSCADNYGSFPCYPMCRRYTSVHLYDPYGIRVCVCNSNVCVIDNVSVNQNDSSVGNAQITQLCPSCTESNPCTCIISSNSLQDTISDAGLTTSFNQYCGEGGTCYNINDDGTLTQVPCQNYLNTGYNRSSYDTSIPVVVFIVGFILFGIVLISMFATTRTKPYTPPEPKTKTKPKSGNIIDKPLGNKTSSTQF